MHRPSRVASPTHAQTISDSPRHDAGVRRAVSTKDDSGDTAALDKNILMLYTSPALYLWDSPVIHETARRRTYERGRDATQRRLCDSYTHLDEEGSGSQIISKADERLENHHHAKLRRRNDETEAPIARIHGVAWWCAARRHPTTTMLCLCARTHLAHRTPRGAHVARMSPGRPLASGALPSA